MFENEFALWFLRTREYLLRQCCGFNSLKRKSWFWGTFQFIVLCFHVHGRRKWSFPRKSMDLSLFCLNLVVCWLVWEEIMVNDAQLVGKRSNLYFMTFFYTRKCKIFHFIAMFVVPYECKWSQSTWPHLSRHICNTSRVFVFAVGNVPIVRIFGCRGGEIAIQ